MLLITKDHSIFISFKYFQSATIFFSKEYLKDYVLNYQNSPLIGVGLKNKIKNKLKKNNIFYQPRLNPGYDVIFFLGLIKLNNTQIKKVLNERIIKNLKL